MSDSVGSTLHIITCFIKLVNIHIETSLISEKKIIILHKDSDISLYEAEIIFPGHYFHYFLFPYLVKVLWKLIFDLHQLF